MAIKINSDNLAQLAWQKNNVLLASRTRVVFKNGIARSRFTRADYSFLCCVLPVLLLAAA